jgi:hypothetical protein
MSEVAEGGGKGVRVRSERASGVVATQKEAARKRSIYVGVVKHKKRWQARIDLHGKTHYLALMEDEAEAAARYDEAAVLHNKPVNFPQNKSQKQAVKRAANGSPNRVKEIAKRRARSARHDHDPQTEDEDTHDPEDGGADEKAFPTEEGRREKGWAKHDRAILIAVGDGETCDVVVHAVSVKGLTIRGVTGGRAWEGHLSHKDAAARLLRVRVLDSEEEGEDDQGQFRGENKKNEPNTGDITNMKDEDEEEDDKDKRNSTCGISSSTFATTPHEDQDDNDYDDDDDDDDVIFIEDDNQHDSSSSTSSTLPTFLQQLVHQHTTFLQVKQELQDDLQEATNQAQQAQDNPTDDGHFCVVCMERERGVLYVPCNHLAVCVECDLGVAAASMPCPMCQEPIDRASSVMGVVVA